MGDINDYKNDQKPAWCPGCGDYGILLAVKKALADLGLKPERVLLVSGIGQAAKLPHYLRCNVFNGLHGRALPAAQGAKICNQGLTVIAVGGDGDMYGEGGNHFLHAIRRNLDMTLLVHNNQIYGLTKGQASPTSDLGMKTKVQPAGVINYPLNPLTLAISQQCSFVARSFSGATEHLSRTIQAAINNPGFSLVDILQPCVTFNHINTHAWYKQRTYELKEGEYDVYDQAAGMKRASEWGEKIPIGIFFRAKRSTYESQIPQLKGGPLVQQKLDQGAVSAIIDSYR